MAVQFPINRVKTQKFSPGHPRPLLAIVHHRMVGTLASTDITFTTGERVASTHFGIGLCSEHGGNQTVCIHQYVRLGDQAWGNGNNHFPEDHAKAGELVPSKWNERRPKARRLVNSRTISIEHQDNGMKGHPKRGIVPDEVIEASIFLDKLLLSGNAKKMKDAGIVFRPGSAMTIAKELKRLTPGPDTIVDHHHIAGPLKPRCWRPWMKDDVGFPRHRYLVALGVAAGDPDISSPTQDDLNAPDDPLEADEDPRPATSAAGDVMKSFATPTVPTLAKIRTDAWLYDNNALDPSPKNIQVKPGREMPLIGTMANKVRIVSRVSDTGTLVGRAFWVEPDDVVSTRPAP